KGSNVPSCGSLPIGVVNLLEDYIRHDPPSPAELKALEWYIEGQIRQLQADLPDRLTDTNLIGTGGTITTLAAIDLSLDHYEPEIVHGYHLALNRLKDMRNKLVSIPISLRKDIKGLERERADLIIPGIILTIKIMDIFKFDELIVSDYGLLEGLLLEGGEDEKGL
ncbi:MAG: Ppx/GppA family phosphatase, partial [Thermodesulfovibrionales bacterium]